VIGGPAVSAHALAANRPLVVLRSADLERWRMRLEWTGMPFGQGLYECGNVPGHVVFAATTISALL
jgi:hypothetical protein